MEHHVKLTDLENRVRAHAGEFLCERIYNETTTRRVRFAHVVVPPDEPVDVPAAGRLREFYATFGSILFYHDSASGDAGRYLAHPSQWAELQSAFGGWIEGLDEDERRDCLPEWIDTCLVIGETPQSGNYILVPTEGPEAGHVFEFDHDGFEFTEEARDVVAYVEKLLNPDSSTLTGIASHMRFIEGDPMVQWCIREMRDNRGRVVGTHA
jgi:hypothetical protein